MFYKEVWLRPLILLCTVFIALAGLAVNLQAYQPVAPAESSIFSALQPPLGLQLQGGEGIPAAVVIETFPNSWHTKTIGLGYNHISQTVLYAHEEYLSDPTTIWNIAVTSPHTPLQSFNLSSLNPGWPVSLNDRDGVEYDPVANSYFLPDFQGDLSARDDNLIEIDPQGVILNAWELDGAGNDSSDGSQIHGVLDIALVPGTPNRYFMTRLQGNGTVYEVALTRAGLFAPASWHTVNTCIVPGIGVNMGIDYDNVHGVLFHSSNSHENIIITDLACNVLFTFSCNGGGNFHTGITYLENSDPAEVWVTDYQSNSTTRCEIPAFTAVSAGEDQTVDEGEVVQFNGIYIQINGLLGDGDTILWDFGDGSTTAGVLTPTHIYTDNGFFTVTLTVTPSVGNSSSDQLLVTVLELVEEEFNLYLPVINRP